MAFTSDRNGNFEVYVMDADGSDIVNLTNYASASDINPAWSPDGTKIAFTSDRDGVDFNIWVMNADGSGLVRLMNEPTVYEGRPQWSPDGTKIAFMAIHSMNEEIFVMNADGSNLIQLTNDLAEDNGPTWSPDGTKIAFASNRDGGDFNIWVMNAADGTGLNRLTFNPGFNNAGPAWSPDGTKIAFKSHRDGNAEIYVMNADGSDQIRLTNNIVYGDQDVAWSPDGTKIAFMSDRDGNAEIYVMDADGANVIRITNDPGHDSSPSWFPNVIAGFTVTSPTTGPSPLTVNFGDESLNNPTGWAWYFGDEDYSAGWTQIDTVSPGWNPRYDHTAVAWYDGSIFLTSGYTGSYQHDVWWSLDNGATWIQDTPGEVGGWTPRYGHTNVVMPDGSIIVMGGLSSTGNMNDVWRSTDGGHGWSAQTGSAEWSQRSGHTSVALPDGDIVLMGGYDGTFRNDVWLSTDNGATWTEQTSNAEWSPRSDHSSVAMPDGSIVLMGGSGNNNEVWRSVDKGVSWTRVDTISPKWTPRYGHTSVVLPDGSIMLMGGDDGARKNDVWRSTDNGATWTELTPNAPWEPRSHASSVVMPDGSIVLMGGYNAVDVYYDDVWRLPTAGSVVQNPVHTYNEPGTYPVALQAFNAGGSGSTRKSGFINVINPALPALAQDAVLAVIGVEGDITGKTI